jgi:DNA replication and repair protein RecF
MVISGGDAAYLDALRRYHTALAGRNQLLKNPKPDAAQLTAFEKTLAPAAAKIVAARQETLAHLAAALTQISTKIGLQENAATLTYEPNAMPSAGASASAGASTGVGKMEHLGEQQVLCKPFTASGAAAHETAATAAAAAAWLELFARHRHRDQLFESTQRGPHRDDFSFSLDAHPARDHASEGQQRALVLGLELAWLQHLRQQRPVAPIVLADDILGELDPTRRNAFWQTLGTDCQCLATGTVPPADAAQWKIIEVRNGQYFE